MTRLSLTYGITDEHLNDVYSDAYIAKVGHDFREFKPIAHPNVAYLTAWVGGKFAGAFMAIKFSPIEYELHSFLKRDAVKHSRELGKMFLDWCFMHPIARVTAYVIEGLESAKNYCMKLGFSHEGFRRNACARQGKQCGVYVLGMTRGEYELCR